MFAVEFQKSSNKVSMATAKTANLLPKDFALLGVSVDDLTLEQFRTQVTGFLPAGDLGTEACEWFTQRLYYQRGEFADPNTYSTLASRLTALDRELRTA